MSVSNEILKNDFRFFRKIIDQTVLSKNDFIKKLTDQTVLKESLQNLKSRRSEATLNEYNCYKFLSHYHYPHKNNLFPKRIL